MKTTLQDVKVQKLGNGGIGIAQHQDGRKILIKGGALPGSIVDLKIIKKRKDHLEAHLINTKSYDPNYSDAEVFCPHFFTPTGISSLHAGTEKIGCGGCKRQMMNYKKQLEIKQQLVEESFGKINAKREKKIRFLPIIWSPLTQGYRNKIEFSFGVYISEKEQIHAPRTCGFHRQGEFSKIVEVESCGLISPKANKVFQYLKKKLKESWIPTYDQKTHQGVFRHMVLREGFNTQQLMVNLSLASQNTNQEQSKIRETLQQTMRTDPFLQQEINTLVLTENTGLADTVKNPHSKTQILRGKGYIEEQLNFQDWDKKVSYRISPFSFFQTNTHGAEQLFATAFTMLWERKGNILDLYCGTGSIGISLLALKASQEKKEEKKLTQEASQLIGIEIVEDAIKDAHKNAKMNNLTDQSLFIASPAEKALERFPELWEKISNLWVVVIDPPREGLHKDVITRIANLKKQHHFKLLYISCNPVTMARDIELLLAEEFDLKEIQPVDMFPHTHHIECIGILE